MLAGPGTGKTTTLVETVAARLESGAVRPQDVLVVTFSRRAATELADRLARRVGGTSREPMVRTLHSYAFRLVRQRAAALGEPAPRLLGAGESDHVVRELLAGHAASDGGYWPPDLVGALLSPTFAAELRDLLLRAAERDIAPGKLVALGRRYHRPQWVAVGRFAQEYQQVTDLRQASGGLGAALDQAELTLAALSALTDDRVLGLEQQRIRRLYVDEYQDVDPAQAALLELLASGADEYIVIGDPDQSIYGFRGSDSAALRSVEVDGTVALNTSRRLPVEILAATRRVAERLSGPTLHRRLTCESDRPGQVTVKVFSNAGQEASFVADELRRAHLLGGVPWSEMAILLRAPAHSLSPISRACAYAGVPLRVGRGDEPLAADPVVAALIDVLRLGSTAALTGQDALDLLSGPFGRLDALALRALRRAVRAGRSQAGSTSDQLAGVLAGGELPADLPERLTAPVRRLQSMLQVAREGARNLPGEEVLWQLWQLAEVEHDLVEAALAGGRAGQRADRSLDAVVTLFQKAADLAERLPLAGVEALTDLVVGQQVPDDTSTGERRPAEAVSVLSAHASKGLEWDVVAVPGVQEGAWPDLRVRTSLVDGRRLLDAAAGLPAGGTGGGIPSGTLNEERRLFYVAATRARQHLICSAVAGEELSPSRFLAELTGSPTDADSAPVANAFASSRRGLHLSHLVADLRRAVVDPHLDEASATQAAAQLARLAAAGVRGAHPADWYGLSGPSTDRSPWPENEPVRLSPSSLEMLTTCGLRVALERRMGGQPQTESQAEGIVVHALAYGLALGVSEEQLQQAVAQHLAAQDQLPPWQVARTRRLLDTMLAAARQWVSGSEIDRRFVGAEIKVDVPLPVPTAEPGATTHGEADTSRQVRLVGRVDWLTADRDGRLVVTDFKTGATAKSQAKAAEHPQLAAYQVAVALGAFAAAMKQSGILLPAGSSGMRSGGAELVYLRSGVPKVRAQPPLSAESQQEWTKIIRAAAVALSEPRVWAQENENCDRCPVRRSCPVHDSGRPGDVVKAVIGADELAVLLGMPTPTTEQETVIEAPLEPALVVAGAGSGKTETMAGRVLYLVANGLVRPDAVLGLTFTRKAASGLSMRIRRRLRMLAVHPAFRDLLQDGGEPEVLTYHSFGGRLISEFGPLLGIEPRAKVLTPTAAWQVARRVVARWDADLDTDLRADQVTERLLSLTGTLSDHLVTADRFRAEVDRIVATLREAPPGPRQRRSVHSALVDPMRRLSDRASIAALADAYAEAKAKNGAIDFGDQMRLAADLALRLPTVGEALRDRFRVVLLDEYQDTGHAQRVILRAVFGHDAENGGPISGHPVTAVGDPIQSIYGWRGASAANLPRFPADFPRATGVESRILHLATSFRNDTAILDLANRLSAPLRLGRVVVPDLRPRPTAGPGTVRVGLYATVEDEDQALAGEIDRLWRVAAERGKPPPTTAVLVRRRADMEQIAAALRARDLPVEVVGLGGLLSEPEVADVVAMLRMLVDPTSGDAALRILGGGRWQLGLADLEALVRRAKELSGGLDRPHREESSGDTRFQAVRDALQAAETTDEVDMVSLVDAIADPGSEQFYSAAGSRRLHRLAEELRRLRARLSEPLTDLVADIERATNLDIEVAVHGPAGRAHLDAFGDVVAELAAGGAGPTELLDYLATAEEREDGLEPGETEPSPGRIQILTVHAAKGLEWQLVAVPQLSSTVFPSTQSRSWLGDPAQLPPSLRGDSADIPLLSIPPDADQSALAAALDRHTDELKAAAQQEEQRLLYVALTRAETILLLSGHHWGRTGQTPRGPSVFLTEIRDAASEVPGMVISSWADAPAPGASNPLTANPRRALWPRDPLGDRRSRVEVGADRVRAALQNLERASSTAPEQPAFAVQVRLAGSGTGPSATGGGEATAGDLPSAGLSAGQPPSAGPPVGQALSGGLSLGEAPSVGLPADVPDIATSTSVPDPFHWVRDVDALLAERSARSETVVDVQLPGGVAVTSLVDMATDPERLARRLRRPVPASPSSAARRGTQFHAWLEDFFAGQPLLDIAELPGASDPSLPEDPEFARLKARFLASAWAARTPWDVELAFTTSIGGITVHGRVDAVFAEEDGSFTVVDWKTGEPPWTGRAAVAVQLAVYRLAVADILALPVDRVRAGFYYVSRDRWVAPVDLLDEPGLSSLIASGHLPGETTSGSSDDEQATLNAPRDMARSSS